MAGKTRKTATFEAALAELKQQCRAQLEEGALKNFAGKRDDA
ncbi:MAG: hypothetical protein PHT15_07460 [Gallionellaceae bacterium]|nr:hypothetical protein [Gallionellaceae bacterium]